MHPLLEYAARIGLPPGVLEYRFAPPRRWRFDLAFPSILWAVEIEGATWTGGRHTRGAGFERDAEKYNRACLLGWRVLRVTTGMVNDGRAFALLDELRDLFPPDQANG